MGYLDNTGLSHFWGKIKAALNLKQDALVSGTNIKTINNTSLLGSGNIDISGGSDVLFVAEYGTTTYAEIGAALNANKLLFCYVSWNDIVCPYIGVVNSQYAFSNLGAGESTVALYVNSSNQWSYATTNLATQSAVNAKQDALVSGTNIKTVNNESLLGSGNIDISGGGAVKGSFSFTGQGGDTVEGEAGILHLPDENDHTFSLGMSGFANEGDPDEEYHLTSDFKFQPDPADYEYGLHWYSDVPIVINGGAGMYLYSNSSGNEIATRGEIQSKANLASPTFTGTPKAPTAAAGTNTTQIATTAFVKTAIDNADEVWILAYGWTGYTYAQVADAIANGMTFFAHYSSSTDDVTLPYVCTTTSGKHVFTNMVGNTRWTIYYDNQNTWSVSSASLAPLASPAFTGNPTATTQAAGNNSTRIATTAFVTTAINNAIGSAISASY